MRTVLLIGALLAPGCDDEVSEPAEPSAAPAGAKDEPKPEAEPAEKATEKVAAGPSEAAAAEVRPTDVDKGKKAAPAIDPTPQPDSTLVTIESSTSAAAGGRMTQNVGLEAMPGSFVPTLAIGCELPCWHAALVWPDGDATFVDVELFRGKGRDTAGAKSLGRYRISDVPPAEGGGRSKVVLALGVEGGALQAHARHRDSGKALPLSRVP